MSHGGTPTLVPSLHAQSILGRCQPLRTRRLWYRLLGREPTYLVIYLFTDHYLCYILHAGEVDVEWMHTWSMTSSQQVWHQFLGTNLQMPCANCADRMKRQLTQSWLTKLTDIYSLREHMLPVMMSVCHTRTSEPKKEKKRRKHRFVFPERSDPELCLMAITAPSHTTPCDHLQSLYDHFRPKNPQSPTTSLWPMQ